MVQGFALLVFLSVSLAGAAEPPGHATKAGDGSPAEWVGTSAIVTAANLDGRLEAFFIGKDSHLYHQWQWPKAGGPWTKPVALSEAPTRGPLSVVANKDGRLEVFYRNRENHLLHQWQISANRRTGGGSWSGADDLSKAPIKGGPSAATNKDGRLEVFYRGPDDHLYHQWQTNKEPWWSTPSDLSGIPIQEDPSAALNTEVGCLEVFYRDKDHHLFHQWQINQPPRWTGPVSLPRAKESAGAITTVVSRDEADGRGNTGVLYRGIDNNIYYQGQSWDWRKGSWVWGDPIRLSTIPSQGAPAATVNKRWGIEVIYKGLDNHLYYQTQEVKDQAVTSAWTEPRDLMNAPVKGPAAVALDSDGSVQLLHEGGAEGALQTKEISSHWALLSSRCEELKSGTAIDFNLADLDPLQAYFDLQFLKTVFSTEHDSPRGKTTRLEYLRWFATDFCPDVTGRNSGKDFAIYHIACEVVRDALKACHGEEDTVSAVQGALRACQEKPSWALLADNPENTALLPLRLELLNTVRPNHYSPDPERLNEKWRSAEIEATKNRLKAAEELARKAARLKATVVAKNGDGHVERFRLEEDGRLIHQWQKPDHSWTEWRPMGSRKLAQFVIGKDSKGTLYAYGVGKDDHQVWSIHQSGDGAGDEAGWNRWKSLGGKNVARVGWGQHEGWPVFEYVDTDGLHYYHAEKSIWTADWSPYTPDPPRQEPQMGPAPKLPPLDEEDRKRLSGVTSSWGFANSLRNRGEPPKIEELGPEEPDLDLELVP